MSRALFVKANEAKLVAMCAELNVGISVIEPLPSGGTRIVLNNSDDAATLSRRLKGAVMDGPVARSPGHVSRQHVPYR